MDEKCQNCGEKQACVPFFLHENAMMHYNKANKRMLIAFIVACVAALIGIGIFVHGNTVREKQLIDLLDKRIAEVVNGVHQQSSP